MTLLKELLTENDGPKPVKVADRPTGTTHDDIFDDNFSAPAAAQQQSPAEKKAKRGGLRAAIAAANAGGSAQAAPAINHAALDDLSDEGDEHFNPNAQSDATGDPEPRPPGTDLAARETGVRAAGNVKAEWMGVDQLPGYMQTGIRRMGRVVFKPLTKAPLEQISILANLGGHGPNSMMELNKIARYAERNSHETRDLSMNFGEAIPGYEPDAKLYVTPKDTYLVVQDEMGRYIYAWDSKETKQAFVRSLPDAPKQID